MSQQVQPDEHWVRVCAVEELAPGCARVLAVEPPVAVYNVAGEFYATDDTCTHAFASLADGYLDGEVIECLFHFVQFNVKSGVSLTGSSFKSLRTYPTKVQDGDVLVDLSSR